VGIDKSGRFWTGDGVGDIKAYLAQLQPGGYRVSTVVVAACQSCGAADGFELRVDGDEGYAERTCVACGTTHLMLDSADVVEDASPVQVRCPCGERNFDIAVGFAKRSLRDFKWVSLGIRCRADGVLGSPADWEIDYSPSRHLLAAV